MYDVIVRWVYARRDEGRLEDEIIYSLKRAGWKKRHIKVILNTPRPDGEPKKRFSDIKRLYSALAVFLFLVLLMTLNLMGIIGNNKIAFTYQKCLDLEIPKNACLSLQAMLDGQPTDEWSFFSSQDMTDSISDFLASQDIFLDLNTWVEADVASVVSSTICGKSNHSLYLIVLSGFSNEWRVEAIRQIDTDSKSFSYCKAQS